MIGINLIGDFHSTPKRPRGTMRFETGSFLPALPPFFSPKSYNPTRLIMPLNRMPETG